MKTALAIIDVQRALCEGQYEVFEAQKIIERINSLSRNAREESIPVVVVQHEAESGVMAHGSEGWQFAHGLILESTDVVLRKTTADSFHKTELHPLLAGLEIEHLVVCGMQSDFCVDTTIRRALALGFSVTLVSDAHSTLPNEHLSAQQIIAHHNTTLSNIQSFGVIATLVPAEAVQFVESARQSTDNDGRTPSAA